MSSAIFERVFITKPQNWTNKFKKGYRHIVYAWHGWFAAAGLWAKHRPINTRMPLYTTLLAGFSVYRDPWFCTMASISLGVIFWPPIGQQKQGKTSIVLQCHHIFSITTVSTTSFDALQLTTLDHLDMNMNHATFKFRLHLMCTKRCHQYMHLYI